MLILTAGLAAFCYWRDRPRQVANRFVAAIEAGDYAAAEAMFGGDRVGIANPPTEMSEWEVIQVVPSAVDWLCGRREVLVIGNVNEIGFTVYAIATATGMERDGDWENQNQPQTLRRQSSRPRRSK